uniref:Uncharacterized protein n=1 Tax=Emiliania huxleyi (strain CCMP1516) TaxID=280463 RepID=A0A0D3JRV1_EMIH1
MDCRTLLSLWRRCGQPENNCRCSTRATKRAHAESPAGLQRGPRGAGVAAVAWLGCGRAWKCGVGDGPCGARLHGAALRRGAARVRDDSRPVRRQGPTRSGALQGARHRHVERAVRGPDGGVRGGGAGAQRADEALRLPAVPRRRGGASLVRWRLARLAHHRPPYRRRAGARVCRHRQGPPGGRRAGGDRGAAGGGGAGAGRGDGGVAGEGVRLWRRRRVLRAGQAAAQAAARPRKAPVTADTRVSAECPAHARPCRSC